ncbi:YggT family protein [Parashewanella spongiae]|uniref:YggT family protein n=1 Tax=Parashewanella spongiae TaxID=342950 RepID=A0A3A6UCJ2_9GAMM|nr:YggT family protein [Parashewanella spongiae]MCL1078309.1 YggT family protein [Parashewanella spongiae]RJY15032.1 YggT family protein [Parashewanella spongiae]
MNAMSFLITTIFDLYLTVVILRLWLQMARADFYNPFSQFVVKVTQPILAPMRRVLPSIGGFDTSTFVLALAVVTLKLTLLSLIVGSSIDFLFILMISFVSVIKHTGTLLFWMLLIRAILSWFNQGYNPFVMMLGQLTDPLLAPIRRIIPPMGGLDLSVMALFIGLHFLNLLFAQYIPFWNII